MRCAPANMIEALRERSGEKELNARRLDLRRIQDALEAAAVLVQDFEPEELTIEWKPQQNDPVTALDRSIDDLLRRRLPEPGEAWLSEETDDDLTRLEKRRAWIVDPLDGTKEFLAGIPEWCISVGLVEEGRAVAGGISNPATGELFLGALGLGVTWNGVPALARPYTTLSRAVVLASRSEIQRGEWSQFLTGPFYIRPTGSVGYKLARVAAGHADATWTFAPKHEWDVAAGIALVTAAGGRVITLDGNPPMFNRRVPIFPGLMAFSADSAGLLERLVWEGWHRARTIRMARPNASPQQEREMVPRRTKTFD